MNVFCSPNHPGGVVKQSDKFSRTMLEFSDAAIAYVRNGDEKLILSTHFFETDDQPNSIDPSQIFNLPTANILRPGRQVGFSPVQVSGSDVSGLKEQISNTVKRSEGSCWQSYESSFADGSIDQIEILKSREATESHSEKYLQYIWPLLREDCLTEILTDVGKFVDDALLWIITDKIASAILVLDRQCRLVRANSAGYDLLKAQNILRSQGNGISCSTSSDTAQLREMVRQCADSGAGIGAEKILMLENRDTQCPSILSLRKFECGPSATMVIAMVPTPPNSERIVMLAREMGLTNAEARIASLMQLGLSNREMAVKAKLTEQTCSTYSKRVLSKLNVNCRAEMAQLLTWQAG